VGRISARAERRHFRLNGNRPVELLNLRVLLDHDLSAVCLDLVRTVMTTLLALHYLSEDYVGDANTACRSIATRTQRQ